jgi:hypothetical protein
MTVSEAAFAYIAHLIVTGDDGFTPDEQMLALRRHVLPVYGDHDAQSFDLDELHWYSNEALRSLPFYDALVTLYAIRGLLAYARDREDQYC